MMIDIPMLALVICAALSTDPQDPPAVSTQPPSGFTASEGQAYWVARQVALLHRSDEGSTFTNLESWSPDQYVMRTAKLLDGKWGFESPAKNGVTFQLASGKMATRLPGPSTQVLYYLIPKRTGATKRIFCVRNDGAVAYTDNEVGTAGSDGRDLLPSDVFKAGISATNADFPRSPSRGRDGNLWRPISDLPLATFKVRVVDESGAAVQRVVVATVPALAEESIGKSLPVGQTATFVEGDGELEGLLAQGCRLVLRRCGVEVPVPTSSLQIAGSDVRVVVGRRSLAKLMGAEGVGEFASIEIMKLIAKGQDQCQASGVIDANSNGQGEYGFIAELLGSVPIRGGTQPIVPKILNGSFSRVEQGRVLAAGYVFQVFLPDQNGDAVAEDAGGGDPENDNGVDARGAESMWCCYAWPIAFGPDSRRAFFIDQTGVILACDNEDGRYSGLSKGPQPKAARSAGGPGKMSDDRPAFLADCLDGQTWRLVEAK